MNRTEYFSILCRMEAYLHMIKAHSLTGEKDKELDFLKLLRSDVNNIFDKCVSEPETKIYFAN